MELDINTLRSIATVAGLITFIGIWLWAYSSRNAADFEEAANLPFDQD
jgi:cytochrome c oxidase cbb3-type subunit 4